MRTPGAVGPSLTLVDASQGAGRGESLKTGALVFVLVRENPEPGLYRVAIGSTLLTAASATRLEIGSLLKARVERSGGRVALRLETPAQPAKPGGQIARESIAGDSLAALLRSAALPNDSASRLALAALLREGLAPGGAALSRMRRAALKEAAEGGAFTELAARMEAKGLPAETDALTRLAGLTGGGAEGGARERRGFAGAQSMEVDEEELPRVLGALLRRLATRTAAGEAGDGISGGLAQGFALPAAEILALFNQLRGPEGSWVIVPFRFALDEVDFSGSFRILLPYLRTGQGIFEARFTASRGERSEEWSFLLGFGGGRASSLRVLAPADKALGAASETLAAAISPCSLRVAVRGQEAEGDQDAGGIDGVEGLDLHA
jgi:hypothetical protein